MIEEINLNTPYNTSLLQSAKFTFIMPDHPFLKYFCQSVSLPSIQATEVAVPTPFSTTYRHGDRLVYNPFTITALIDEDFRVWEETYNWMIGLTTPDSFDQYRHKNKKDKDPPLYYDAYLSINTNSNTPNYRLKFLDCHPTELGMVNFDVKVNAEVIPTCDITFRYDRYHIERLAT